MKKFKPKNNQSRRRLLMKLQSIKNWSRKTLNLNPVHLFTTKPKYKLFSELLVKSTQKMRLILTFC